MNKELLLCSAAFSAFVAAYLCYFAQIEGVTPTSSATYHIGAAADSPNSTAPSSKKSGNTTKSARHMESIKRSISAAATEKFKKIHGRNSKLRSPAPAVGTFVNLKKNYQGQWRVEGFEPGDFSAPCLLKAFDSERFIVLTGNGKLLTVPGSVEKQTETTSQRFERFSTSQMKSQLRKNWSRNFRTYQSRFFLLVVSKDISETKARKWGEIMDGFYRSLEAYLKIRDLPITAPKNKLVAMIFSSRNHMNRYAAELGDQIRPNYAAYYSSRTNRISLYDSKSHTLDHPTIFHETAHQILFNRGFHYRSIPYPRWLTEGIASSFEAPGLYDHRRNTKRFDRLQKNYLRHFQSLIAKKTAQSLINKLIESDDPFQQNPSDAYAAAWAMTFYSLETRSDAFGRFVMSSNRQEPFLPVRSGRRKFIMERSYRQSAHRFSEDVVRFFSNSKNFQ